MSIKLTERFKRRNFNHFYGRLKNVIKIIGHGHILPLPSGRCTQYFGCTSDLHTQTLLIGKIIAQKGRGKNSSTVTELVRKKNKSSG